VLSEMPGAWRLALARWRRMNRGPGRAAAITSPAAPSAAAPSAADEYLLYQTLLGTWPAGGLDEAALPAYRERISQYMVKAAREAKLHTQWVNPDAAYETALTGFVATLLARVRPNPFLADLQEQARAVAWFGALNSLTLTLLKFTSPGVPDVYQGNEVMDLSLVDPDNRRPVDFVKRERWLDEMQPQFDDSDDTRAAAALAALVAAPHDGRAKLWFTARLLDFRRRAPELCELGDYTALAARGARAAHVVAYRRQLGESSVLVLAGRLFAQLGQAAGETPVGLAAWEDTCVPASGLRDGERLVNALNGEVVTVEDGLIRLADAFRTVPAAALVPATTARR